jgi:putative transposase
VTGSSVFHRRHLPHWYPPYATYFVTFRLVGSLPSAVCVRLKQERILAERRIMRSTPKSEVRSALDRMAEDFFRKYDDLLDSASAGPRWLGQREVAELVNGAIQYRDGKDYDLLAHTIMSNHVHLVFEVPGPGRVSSIMKSLKGWTAYSANRLLGRCGTFWQDESYDHVVREWGNDLERTIWYTLTNPVAAGLADHWWNWPWTYISPRFGLSRTD